MWLRVQNPPANAGDAGSIPGRERAPGGANDSPLQYFCLESPMDRGARWAAVPGVAKESNMTATKQEQSLYWVIFFLAQQLLLLWTLPLPYFKIIDRP